MKRKRICFILLILTGAFLLVAGGLIFTSDSQKTFSGYCIGVGAALTVLGAGWLADSFFVSVRETEEIQKIKKIEMNDERNVRIRERAGATVARIMNYVLTAFVVILGLTGAQPHVIVMAACLLVIEFILTVCYSNYYSRRM